MMLWVWGRSRHVHVALLRDTGRYNATYLQLIYEFDNRWEKTHYALVCFNPTAMFYAIRAFFFIKDENNAVVLNERC